MGKPLLKITFKDPEFIFSMYGNFKCEFIISNNVTNCMEYFVIDRYFIDKQKIKSIEFIQPNEI